MTITLYVPGTEEQDQQKLILSLQQIAGKLAPALSGQLTGTTTDDDAAVGYVGEYVSSTIALASAVSLTTATNADITSISLTAGDWDVTGNVDYNPGVTTNYILAFHSISENSTMQDASTGGGYALFRFPTGIVPVGSFTIGGVGPVRKSLAATTTIYLVARADFTVSTMSAYGILRARRVR